MDSLEAVRSLREIQLDVTRRHAVKGDIYGIRSREAYDALHRVLITRGLARIYCGVLDGNIVMAALCSTYRGRARGIYNGASQRGLEVRASTAVIWRIIEELAEEGYEELSLGIAEPSVEDPSSLAHGLHEFKLDLGAESRRVPFASRELSPPRVLAHRVLRRAASALSRAQNRG
jgi:lipid II:glycine glycyltransferase (peptidoglycan interpeptide bridge formation enzyme)